MFEMHARRLRHPPFRLEDLLMPLLGQAAIATTQIYPHVPEGRIKSLVQTKQPLAKRR